LLVGSTLAILIGAGAIAALSLLISLYFQDPSTLGMSSLMAGLATLPLAAVVVAVAPAITPLTHRFGTREIIAAGFVLLTASFAILALTKASWGYGAFLLPLLGVALGLGLSNGPSSAISTACVSPSEVGAASGISNMARYVGGAVMTAVAAGIYANVAAARQAAGADPGPALAAGFSIASLVLAILCASGVALAVLAGRRPPTPHAVDYAAAAAATVVTVPVQSPTAGAGDHPPA
jgi:MFS family permease